MISGFHHKVDEICALLGNYEAYSGNCYPHFRTTYQSQLHGSSIQKERFLTLEDGTNRLSRHISKELPHLKITTMCCIISQKSTDIGDLHVYDFM
jgi:hypothetical protein